MVSRVRLVSFERRVHFVVVVVFSLGGHKSRWNDGGVFPDDANTPQSAASASRSNETTARPRATKRGSFATSLKRARETERGLERALRFLSVLVWRFCVERERKLSSQKSFLLTKKFLDGNPIQSNPMSVAMVCPTTTSWRPAKARAVVSSDQKRGLRLRFAGGNGGYVVGRERGVKAQKMDDDIARFISERENCDIASQKSSGSSQWASFRTYETADGSRKFFVKLSRKDDAMFRGEKAGLDALRRAGSPDMMIPTVYYAGGVPDGCRDGNSMIVMEYLNFGARGDQEEFGLALAKMHNTEIDGVQEFGFEVNNTIGETPQKNIPMMKDWETFWVESRLLPQLKMTRDSELQRLGDEVIEKRVPEMFKGLEIKPSILHGDLWSGNIGTVDGKPSIFDPAVYYGHHEADFGMSWCAGFSPAFYEAYWSVIKKDEGGFEERKVMYQLYHILNHYNMFGGGYRSQAMGMLKQLL